MEIILLIVCLCFLYLLYDIFITIKFMWIEKTELTAWVLLILFLIIFWGLGKQILFIRAFLSDHNFFD